MPDKKSEIIDVIMKDNYLILSDNLITLLEAKAGDRISIGYIESNGNLVPIINSGTGNKLNSNNTVSFRGHQKVVLNQFGTNFWAKKKDEVIYLIGDGLPIFTDVKKASQNFITKEIIEDTNYQITKITNYEF